MVKTRVIFDEQANLEGSVWWDIDIITGKLLDCAEGFFHPQTKEIFVKCIEIESLKIGEPITFYNYHDEANQTTDIVKKVYQYGQLNDWAVLFRTDKKIPDGVKAQNGLSGHGYTPHYEEFFSGQKFERFLEIGVSYGGSLRMWKSYMPDTEIHGMDITTTRFSPEQLTNDGFKIHIGDQTKREDLLHHFGDLFFDVIIDDGSHRMKAQQVTLITLFERVKSGGWYVIEDLHTSEIKGFYDSNPELLTTKKLLFNLRENVRKLANRKALSPIFGNYLTTNDYFKIVSNIKAIYFRENSKICFIQKK